MSVAAELANEPGAIAAGECSHRGDRFSSKGDISDEMARMAAIMCRATTMGGHIQADMRQEHYPSCGVSPPKGCIVRGPAFSVCNVANVFCFIDNSNASMNHIIALMRKRSAGASHDPV